MQSRNSLVRLAVLGLTAAVALGMSAGCGHYSINSLKARKAYKDAIDAYKQQEYSKAAQDYETVLQLNPNPDADSGLTSTYFYLGNSYDNLYKATKKGDPTNDAYLQKAADNYRLAAERSTDVTLKKYAYEFLIALYGADKLNDFSQAEPYARKLVELDPNDPANYQTLGKLYEDNKRLPEAEAAFKKAVEVKPSDPTVYQMLAGYYNRTAQFVKTMEAFNERAAHEPNNPDAYHTIATYYEDEVLKDRKLDHDPAKRREYIDKGLEADDKALALNPNFFEAMVYKGILLIMKANTEPNAAKSAEYRKEGNEWTKRATDLQKKQNSGGRGGI